MKRVPRKVERASLELQLVYYHINLSCVFGGMAKSIRVKGVERDIKGTSGVCCARCTVSVCCVCECVYVCMFVS